MLKAMLATDPAERVTAAEALRMLEPALNGSVQLPARAGSLLPIGVDPEEEEADAPHAKAKRARREGDDGLSVAAICGKLGTQSPQTVGAAQAYYRLSETAQSEGLGGRAACVLLACKIFEPETWLPHDMCDVPELADFDTNGYPWLELAVLHELGYCLVFPPSAPAPDGQPLRERN
eukprot:4871158-Prymnesium_polylepis.1